MLASSALRGSTFCGQSISSRRVAIACPCRHTTVSIEAAHKKGAGSTKNGRDSESKRRGVKVYGGQPVKAGGIIYRQCGSTWHAGDNVGTGKDYTIFSKVDGIVIYSKKPGRDVIHVYPHEHDKAQAAVKKTHTTAPLNGVSRKERRRAQWTPRAQLRAGAAAPAPAAVVAAVAVTPSP